MAIELFLASVCFMPSGHHLGLRRLYAVGAKVCSYRGRVAGLFFSSAARRQKRRKGSGRIARSKTIEDDHQGRGVDSTKVSAADRDLWCIVLFSRRSLLFLDSKLEGNNRIHFVPFQRFFSLRGSSLRGNDAPHAPRSARPTGSTVSSASGKQLPLPHKAARVVNWGWWRSAS